MQVMDDLRVADLRHSHLPESPGQEYQIHELQDEGTGSAYGSHRPL
jgi:hypothetical protein